MILLGKIWGYGKNYNNQFGMVEEEYGLNNCIVTKTANVQKLGVGPSYEKYYNMPVCINDIVSHPLNGIIIADIDLSRLDNEWENYGIALDNTGKVYYWGYFRGENVFNVTLESYQNDSNINVKKVLGYIEEWAEKPTCINTLPGSTLADVTITKISAGYGHSLFLDNEGKIWSFGKGGYGSYIRGNEGDAYFDYMPICINDFERDEELNTEYTSLENVEFSEISAGYRMSMAIDSIGNVWGWGYDYGHNENFVDSYNYFTEAFKGQNYTVNKLSFYDVQKISREGYESNIPVCLSKATDNPFYGVKATKISTGYSNSLILDTTGRVWGFGEEWTYRNDGSDWYIAPVLLGTDTSEEIHGKTISYICTGSYNSGLIDSQGNYYLYGQYAWAE